MNARQILIRDLLVLFGLTGWAVALPGFASEFVTSMALTCLMYVALSSSWALFCGTTRYLSLATSAFFGIGAYTSALSLEHMPWAQAVALGALIAAAVAIVMGAAVLHLRGTYFAVLTFGMTELIRHAISYFEKSVTGTVGRVLMVVPEASTVYYTVLLLAVPMALSGPPGRLDAKGLGVVRAASVVERPPSVGTPPPSWPTVAHPLSTSKNRPSSAALARLDIDGSGDFTGRRGL